MSSVAVVSKEDTFGLQAFVDAAAGGDPVLQEVNNYHLSYAFQKRLGRAELIMISSTGHRAVYVQYVRMDDDGGIIGRPPITPDVAKFIFDNFAVRGHTESFNILARDLETGRLSPRLAAPKPEDVRHKLGNTENSFTATGAKLAAHWPIFHKLRDTGYGSIIRATLTNHQVCSSRCHFCSTIARNKRDSVTLEEAQNFVTALYDDQAAYNREHFAKYNDEYRALTGSDIRLRGLILSGGGQPNLWPHFTEFVRWLAERDIDLGLITNGFPQKIPEDVYKHFKWVRISVTPADASSFYPDGKFERQYIPSTLKNNPDITVGYSYVDGPWAEEDILQRIDKSAVENGFQYARVLTDCNLGRSAQLQAHHNLAEKLHDIGLVSDEGVAKSRVFQQLKYHGTEDEAQKLWDKGQCFLQSYNVFWDTTGHEENGHSYCYPCDSVTVLSDDAVELNSTASERRFNSSKWGTVPNTEVAKLYTEKLHPFFDPREICHSCLFMRNNQATKALINRADYSDIKLPANIQHQNFP
ncbi:radical SAM protein [Ferrovibrio terrae]|uniref:radical SAM protein n=1 Tax=Ferrovibrio terrae TaxID=2594003 RepID=UPI003137788F